MQAKKRMDNYGNCVLDVLLILEDSVSMCTCPLYTTVLAAGYPVVSILAEAGVSLAAQTC